MGHGTWGRAVDTAKVGADIWWRASHNKLAQERAAERAARKAGLWSWAVAILVAVPTIYAASSAYASGLAAAGAGVASVAGGVALILAIRSPIRECESTSRFHQELANNYGRIAQRARRLDGTIDKDSAEANWLVQTLQQDMEMQKGSGHEASSDDFKQALTRMQDLQPYPFASEIADRTSGH
jgi:hypothetical protein